MRRLLMRAGVRSVTGLLGLAAVMALAPFGPPATPPAAASAAAAAPKAYIGLFRDNALAVLDTATNQVTATIPVPPGPHGIVATPDGQKIYVSSDGASTVSVVDAATDSLVGSVEVGPEPHGLAMTPDGRRLLVGGWGTNRVIIVDTADDRATGEVAVASPHNIAVSPDGRVAYVGSQAPGAPTLAVLDLDGRSVIASLPLEKNPRGLSVSPDGRWLYLTQAGLDAVAVFDVTSSQLTARIPVGPSPHFPLFTAGGLGLVDSQGLGQLAVLDPASHTVNATVPVGNGPRKIALQPIAGGGARPTIASRIAGLAFEPTIPVTLGQTVTWTNADAVLHTVTAVDRRWDSGPLEPGASFSVTPEQPGAYAYRCSLYPYMRGELVVD